jgi:hypothetical protein
MFALIEKTVTWKAATHEWRQASRRGGNTLFHRLHWFDFSTVSRAEFVSRRDLHLREETKR